MVGLDPQQHIGCQRSYENDRQTQPQGAESQAAGDRPAATDLAIDEATGRRRRALPRGEIWGPVRAVCGRRLRNHVVDP